MTDTFLAESGGFEALRQTLVQAVGRWTRDAQDVQTPIANLGLFRRTAPTQPDYCMVGPSLFIVVQGSKRALFGQEAFTYDINNFLITSLDLPAMMHIVEASEARPYLGLMLRLDLRVVSEVMLQSGFAAPAGKAGEPGMFLGRTSPALLRALVRLVSLLDEPESIPLLAPLIEREIYYRLIASDQSARLWQVTAADSQVHRIARAVDWIRHNYRQTLRVEELAASVKMSPSTFHQHFKRITAMSPLQYQKQLRLQEARRLLMSEAGDVASVAHRVGYESPSQFSREYSRQFGAPPSRDVEQLRRSFGRAVATG